jgi:hypothetical protein
MTQDARIKAAAKAFDDVLWEHARGYEALNPTLHTEAIAAALAAADAVTGRTVVSTDDLRAVLDAFGESRDPWPEDYDAADRLKAAITD